MFVASKRIAIGVRTHVNCLVCYNNFLTVEDVDAFPGRQELLTLKVVDRRWHSGGDDATHGGLAGAYMHCGCGTDATSVCSSGRDGDGAFAQSDEHACELVDIEHGFVAAAPRQLMRIDIGGLYGSCSLTAGADRAIVLSLVDGDGRGLQGWQVVNEDYNILLNCLKRELRHCLLSS